MKSNVKIKKVIVDKLFGIFDHEITLNNNNGITIIIGENGLGKTAILEMIYALFHKKYDYLESIEFKSLILEFSDGITWTVNKENTSLKVNEDDKSNKNKSYDILSRAKIMRLYRAALKISRRSPYLKHIEHFKWEDIRNNMTLNPIEVINMYENDIRRNRHYIKQVSIFNDKDFYSEIDSSLYDNNEPPLWFIERIDSIDVTFIRTQRLILINDDLSSNSTIDAVEKYSEELSKEIKQKLAESTELSSKLDRTYPNRLIEKIKNGNKEKISSDKIMDLLKKLETKRNLLDKVGLVQTEKYSLDISKMDFSEDIVIDVLYEYIQDSFKKLKIFDEISQKIKLLLDVINSRFKHKVLSIDKETGFNFKSTIETENNEYSTIQVNKLSSGEQNELVLFYELIFKSQSNSLILIDEPEISLHITWQNNFISDLKKIIKLNKLDVLMATHSPDIIGNDWDLSVELKGVE